jgi:hypothetical protein
VHVRCRGLAPPPTDAFFAMHTARSHLRRVVGERDRCVAPRSSLWHRGSCQHGDGTHRTARGSWSPAKLAARDLVDTSALEAAVQTAVLMIFAWRAINRDTMVR